MNKVIDPLMAIHQQILDDPRNADFLKNGQFPLYQVSKDSQIVIIGQAPGVKAMERQKAWDDKSGERLKKWLTLDDNLFYDASKVAILPLDFFYPGKAKSGDLPPRDFFSYYVSLILNELKHIKIIILVGTYAQKYYLKAIAKANLTKTIQAYEEYLPSVIVLPHPSPLNFRWIRKNVWFESEVIPHIQKIMHEIKLTI